MRDIPSRYDPKKVEEPLYSQWEKDGTYKVKADKTKDKFYSLDTWAYPSAEGVHIGYVKSFCGKFW